MSSTRPRLLPPLLHARLHDLDMAVVAFRRHPPRGDSALQVAQATYDLLAAACAAADAYRDPKPRTCRKCRCTEFRACEGGCSWVQDDLCSSCVPRPRRRRRRAR